MASSAIVSMGPIGGPEIIVILMILGIPAAIVTGIVFLIIFLVRKNRDQ